MSGSISDHTRADQPDEDIVWVLWRMPPELSSTGSGEWVPVMRQVQLPLSVATDAVRNGFAVPGKLDFDAPLS